jgi:hypothetical protein
LNQRASWVFLAKSLFKDKKSHATVPLSLEQILPKIWQNETIVLFVCVKFRVSEVSLPANFSGKILFLANFRQQNFVSDKISFLPEFRFRRNFTTMWTPAYIPGDHPASWMYSTTCVQYLYISCYLSDNKPVLPCRTSCCAYFHSGDPDQVVPFVL